MKKVANGVKCFKGDKGRRPEKETSDFCDWALRIYFLFSSLFIYLSIS